MTNEHPITPLPELVMQLIELPLSEEERLAAAYRAGADQKLEACIERLDINGCPDKWIDLLRDLRLKPPSLKEQALAVLDDASDRLNAVHENIIRRALEALPDTP